MTNKEIFFDYYQKKVCKYKAQYLPSLKLPAHNILYLYIYDKLAIKYLYIKYIFGEVLYIRFFCKRERQRDRLKDTYKII